MPEGVEPDLMPHLPPLRVYYLEYFYVVCRVSAETETDGFRPRR